ncbi:MAG: hypothetical protein EBU90_11450 [Proteobacteria bacterium]|nr:hypothetical protein [Pseudomonadota bacterium]NBP14594.1 hypothetical protein [bacterium]
MKHWEITINDQIWRRIDADQQPSMNQILEWYQHERFYSETNLDQQYRMDLAIKIDVKQVS